MESDHICRRDGNKKRERAEELHHRKHATQYTLALELGPRNARSAEASYIDNRAEQLLCSRG